MNQRNWKWGLGVVFVVFVFILMLNFIILFLVDPVTAKLSFLLAQNNTEDFLLLCGACFIISIWSFNQSLFFIRLAITVKSIFQIIYLFVSDFLLSLLIVLVGISAITAMYSFISTDDGLVKQELFFTTECKNDCPVTLVGTRVGGLLLPKDPSLYVFPSLDSLLDAINETNIYESVSNSNFESDKITEVWLNVEISYNIKVETELLPPDLASNALSRFAVLLNFHTNEISQYFLTNFEHFSFIPISFQANEFLAPIHRATPVFKLLTDPLVTDFIDRIALIENISAADAAKLTQVIFENLSSANDKGYSSLAEIVEIIHPEHRHEFMSRIKVLVLGRHALVSVSTMQLQFAMQQVSAGFVSVSAEGLGQNLSRSYRSELYKSNGVFGHYLPFTPLLITTISFSFIFVIFLIVSPMVRFISFLDTRLGESAAKIPFTTFSLLFLPVVILISVIRAF